MIPAIRSGGFHGPRRSESIAATKRILRTAGFFLDAITAIAHRETKKSGEFILPGIGKLLKQKRKARMGFK